MPDISAYTPAQLELLAALPPDALTTLPSHIKLGNVEGKLALLGLSNTPFYIDWSEPSLLAKLKTLRRKNELISKATGLNKRSGLTVLDGTAGVGEDSLTLACLGANVTMLEQHPLLFVLLQDGLHRAQEHPFLAQVTANLTLYNEDFCHFVPKTGQTFDTLYLDPMFPHKSKKALPPKKMQVLQQLTQNPQTDAQLWHHALQLKAPRVVIKRPAKSGVFNDIAPQLQVVGKSHRFDIYLTVSIPSTHHRVDQGS